MSFFSGINFFIIFTFFSIIGIILGEEQLNISIGIMEMDKEVVNTPRKIIDFIKNRK